MLGARALHLKSLRPARAIWTGAQVTTYKAMPRPESFPIDKIYVPVKERKKALKPELVREIAGKYSGNRATSPHCLVQPDEDAASFSSRDCTGWNLQGSWRKNNHRVGLTGPSLLAKDAFYPSSAEAEAERDKMARLKKLRLEKEAARN